VGGGNAQGWLARMSEDKVCSTGSVLIDVRFVQVSRMPG
jgi:hypothetical protein